MSDQSNERLEAFKKLTEAVKLQATGRWPEIFCAISPSLATVARAEKFKHVNCVFKHGGKKDLRMAKGGEFGNAYLESGTTVCSCGIRDGFQSLMDAESWSFSETVRKIAAELGIEGELSPEDAEASQKRHEEFKKKEAARNRKKDKWIRETLNAIAQETVSIHESVAEPGRAFFRDTRGLNPDLLDGRFVRFHPALEVYENNEVVDKVPAIVCSVYACDGTPITLHITRLTPKGRKHPRWGRWIFPVASCLEGHKGRVIPAMKPDCRILGISEGLESGLAAAEGFGVQTWPLIAERNVRSFTPPGWCEVLIVFQDKDLSGTGEAATQDLVARLKAISWPGVVLAYEPNAPIPEGKKGIDWNDFKQEYGLEAFPKVDLRDAIYNGAADKAA